MTATNVGQAYQIICDAMEDAGLLMDGSTPDSEQLAKYSRRLVKMVNLWQTQGLKLWLLSDTAVPLVANQSTYTFSPGGNIDMTKPLKVIQGYYLYNTSGTRRPVTPLSYNEWLLLGNVSNTGAVSQYFVDKQQTQLIAHTWLIPDSSEASNGVLHVLLQTQVAQFTNLTDTLNFPIEWAIALEWGLSAEICTGQPMAIVQKCEKNADIYRRALEDWDVEDAPMQFQMDSRMNQGTSGNFQ